MDSNYIKEWLKASGVRALKTFAQTMISTIGTTAVLTGIDWRIVFSSASVAAILSILTSVAGLPELKVPELKQLVDELNEEIKYYNDEDDEVED